MRFIRIWKKETCLTRRRKMDFLNTLYDNDIFYVGFFILCLGVAGICMYDILQTALVIAKATMYGTLKAVDNIQFKYLGNIFVQITVLVLAVIAVGGTLITYNDATYQFITYLILAIILATIVFMYAGKKEKNGMTVQEMQEKTKSLTANARKRVETKQKAK